MRKRLLFIGLLVAGVVLLSGCELLDQIIDAITGGGTPGGDISYGEPSGGEIVDAHITYWLMVTLSERDWPDAPITTRVGPIAAGFQPDTTATFQPDPGTYNMGTKTFTATWDGQDDFSNTYLEVRLSDTEEYVNFRVRQTQSNIVSLTGNVWTYVDELRGYNIQHSHWSEDRRSRFYEVLGVGTGAFDLLTHEGWVYDLELGSTFLSVWVNNSVHDIIPDPGNHIYIQVEYSEPQP